MWTKRAHFIVIYFQINKFVLPIAMPAFAINSLVTELGDLVSFFTFFSRKINAYIEIAEGAVYTFCELEKYDYVNIDVNSKNDNNRVKIKICTR